MTRVILLVLACTLLSCAAETAEDDNQVEVESTSEELKQVSSPSYCNNLTLVVDFQNYLAENFDSCTPFSSSYHEQGYELNNWCHSDKTGLNYAFRLYYFNGAVKGWDALAHQPNARFLFDAYHTSWTQPNFQKWWGPHPAGSCSCSLDKLVNCRPAYISLPGRWK